MRSRSVRTKVLGSAIAAALFACVGWIVMATSTLRDFHGVVGAQTASEMAPRLLGIRLLELGEMAANMPYSVFPLRIQGALPFLGAAVLALLAAGLFLTRRSIGPKGAFFLSYAAIIFVWPCYDPRFWLPVIPMAIAYVGLAVRQFLRYTGFRPVGQAYLAFYSFMGIMTIAASTAMSFSGPNFPDLYDEQYRSTYCAVLRSCVGQPNAPVDELALHVYETYR